MPLLKNPPMTARQLAEKLLALPNPDAPVFMWAPGQYWEPQNPHLQQCGGLPHAWAMIEVDQARYDDVWNAAKEFG